MRKRIALIMVACIFALTGCANVEPDQEKASVPTDMTISVENPQMTVTDQSEILKDVLLGDSPFFYCSDENTETMFITDVPALFDENDPLMKVWEFSVVDMNGDGVTEVGIAAIVDFSEVEYTVDKITYATGRYKGWDTFVADHHPVTEEEYLDAVSVQDQKQNAEWYEFNDENINTLFH